MGDDDVKVMSEQDDGSELLEGFGGGSSKHDDDESSTDSSLSLELAPNNNGSPKGTPVRSASPMLPRPTPNKASKKRFAALNKVMGGKGILPKRPSANMKSQEFKTEEELIEERLGLHVPEKRTGEFSFSSMKSSNHSYKYNNESQRSLNSSVHDSMGSSCSPNDDSSQYDEGDFFVDFPTNREEILDSRLRESEHDKANESDLEKIEEPLQVEEEIDQRKPWRTSNSKVSNSLGGVLNESGGSEMFVEAPMASGRNTPDVSNHLNTSSHLSGHLSGSGNISGLNPADIDSVDGTEAYDNIGFYFEDEKKKVDDMDASSDITDYSTRSSVISELQHAKAALGWKEDQEKSFSSLSSSVQSLTQFGESSSGSIIKTSIDEPDMSRERRRRKPERTPNLPTIEDDDSVQSDIHPPKRDDSVQSDIHPSRRESCGTLGELRRERDGLKSKPRDLRDSLEPTQNIEKSPRRLSSLIPKPPNRSSSFSKSPEQNQKDNSNTTTKASNTDDSNRDKITTFSSGLYSVDGEDVYMNDEDKPNASFESNDDIRSGYVSNDTLTSKEYERRGDDQSAATDASPFLLPKTPVIEKNRQGSLKLMRRSSSSLPPVDSETEVASVVEMLGEQAGAAAAAAGGDKLSVDDIQAKSSEERSKRSDRSKSTRSSGRSSRHSKSKRKSKRDKKQRGGSRNKNGMDIPIPGDDLSLRTPEDSKEEEKLAAEFSTCPSGSVASNAQSSHTRHSVVSKSMDSISECEDPEEKEASTKDNHAVLDQGPSNDIEQGNVGADITKESPMEQKPLGRRGRRLSLVTSLTKGEDKGVGFQGVWDDDEALARKNPSKKSSILNDSIKTTLRTKSWGLKMQRIFGTRCWNWKITIISSIAALLILLCIVIPLSLRGGDDSGKPSPPPNTASPSPNASIQNPPSTSPSLSPSYVTFTEITKQVGVPRSETGRSVSMATDGRYVAIGSPGIGKVQILERNNGEYVPFGNPIESDVPDDNFGFSVSLSDSGEIVVVGAPLANNNVGYAAVYKFDATTSTWNQFGAKLQNLYSNGRMGSSVAISGDGKRLAVGMPRATDNNGVVRIFEYDELLERWVRIGRNIEGQAGELMGYSLSLDETGETVAIGAVLSPHNDDDKRGRVYVLRFDSRWKQIGNALDGADLFGRSVSLSSDGSIVAVGSPRYNSDGQVNAGACEVYRYLESWKRLGTALAGEADEERSGYSIALSRDGTKVACGGEGGSVARVHKYNSTYDDWEQIGDDVLGGESFGASVAIDNSGRILAVGAPEESERNTEGVDPGIVRIFQYR